MLPATFNDLVFDVGVLVRSRRQKSWAMFASPIISNSLINRDGYPQNSKRWRYEESSRASPWPIHRCQRWEESDLIGRR